MADENKYDIRALQYDAFVTAETKGWHSLDRSLVEEIALAHSELSEALEEVRNGADIGEIQFERTYPHPANVPGKPEGVAVEFADVLIRIFDTCKQRNIPLIEALLLKLEYNKTRPHLHGGKKL